MCPDIDRSILVAVDLRFNHNIVAGTVAVGARLAVACDAGVDKFRVYLRDAFIVHAIFLQGTRQVVFNQNITVFGQAVQDFDTGLMLKREAE